MNYLSHYFADRHEGQPHYNFGLVLPDMLGTVNRGWRAASALNGPYAQDINRIWEGYKQHIVADAHFHSSGFFQENTRYIRLQFAAAGLSLPGTRHFFAAHVLFELLLDRLLVKNFSYLADAFYHDIGRVANEDIHTFFQAMDSEPPERFFPFFDRFKESRYIYSYAEDEQLLYAFNRIMQRARQQQVPEHERSGLIELVYKLEEKMYSPFIELYGRDAQ